jgi:hypothetical protein
MVAMNRVKVVWSGFSGGPGVGTHYFGSGVTDMTALKAFYTSMAIYIPGTISMQIPVVGDQINDTDGLIIGSWTGSNGGQVNGAGGAGVYSGVSGVVVDWLGSGVIAGRRRQGRTFFVPTVTTAYQSDGTILESARAQILGWATTLIAAYAGELKIFSRPFLGKAGKPDADPPIPAKPPRPGAAVQVIGAKVPDIATVLRSRRS